MKTLTIVAILVAAAYYGLVDNGLLNRLMPTSAVESDSTSDGILAQAFAAGQSNLQVRANGTVIKILPDDTQGSRHQRFIIELASGQTLLIAHNIDLASRVSGLQTGDRVEVFGEYEWNAKGGVIHWTHSDPAGRHVAGWIKRVR